MKRKSTRREGYRDRIGGERSLPEAGEPASELPARSRTQALALEEQREDGKAPSIRVVPPK